MSRREISSLVFILLTVSIYACCGMLNPGSALASDDMYSALFGDTDPTTEISRTENSRHFRNPDGSTTAYISMSPIHYRDGDGNFQLFDFNPVSSTQSGYLYEITGTDLQSFYPSDATSWIKVQSRSGFSYRWKETGMYYTPESGVPVLLSSPTHASPITGLSSITYHGIYGSVNSVLTSSPGTVKHNYYLSSLPSNLASYTSGYLTFTSYLELDSRLSLYVNGEVLLSSATTTGAISLRTSAGVEILRIPAPIATQIGLCTEDSIEQLSYEVVRDGNGFRLSVLTPISFLKNSETKYPLAIDPSTEFRTSMHVSDTNEQGYTYNLFYTGSTWNTWMYMPTGGTVTAQGAFVGSDTTQSTNTVHSMAVWKTTSLNAFADIIAVETRLYQSSNWSFSGSGFVVDVFSIETDVFASPISVDVSTVNARPPIGSESDLYNDMGDGNQYGNDLFGTWTMNNWYPGTSTWWDLGEDAVSDCTTNLEAGFFGLGFATQPNSSVSGQRLATFAAYDDVIVSSRNMLKVTYEDSGTINIDSDYRPAVLSIDGVVFETLPAVYNVPYGMRNFAAEEEVLITMGQERYGFSHWYDGETAPTRFILINGDFDFETVIMTHYLHEFFLEIDSIEGNVGGHQEGWYTEGSSITTFITGSTGETIDTRRLAIGWTANGAAQAEGQDQAVPDFILDQYTKIVWEWEIQYKLSMQGALSEYLEGGPGWYFRNQDMTNIGVFPYTQIDPGVRKYASGWTAVGAIGDGSGNVIPTWTMSKPSIITWIYEIRYELGIDSLQDGITGDIADYYAPGTEINTAVTRIVTDIVNPGTRYEARSWSATGSLGDGTGFEIPTFVVNEPTYIIWDWTTQYQISMNTLFGQVSPANETWFDEGAVVTISAQAPPNDSTQRYSWVGWSGTGAGSIEDGNTSETITMYEPISQTANWDADFWLSLNPGSGDFEEDVSGWYAYNSSVVLRAIQPAPALDTRYILGWTGTGTGVRIDEPSQGTSTVISIKILDPTYQEAIWITQYRVKIRNSVTYGNPIPPVGDYWISHDEVFHGSVMPNVSGMLCSGFVGTGSIPSSSLPIFSAVITQPSSITWQWEEGQAVPLNTWAESQLVAQGFRGRNLKAKLSSDGTFFAVAFYSNETRQLRCHTLYQGQWNEYILATGDNVGTFLALDMDSNNNPHIAYFDGVTKEIRYASFIQESSKPGVGSFSEEVIEVGDYGRSISLGINSMNRANLLYYDELNGDVRYLRETEEGWLLLPIFSDNDIGYYCDIAITPLVDIPQIVYLDKTENAIKYATLNDGRWTIETVATTPNVFGPFSISLDIGGRPFISFQEYLFPDTHRVYIAWGDEDGWHSSFVVDETTDAINSTYLIDSSGFIHLAYNNGERLLYLRYNGISWERMTLDLGPAVHWNLDIAMDENENIVIFYWMGNDLKILHTTDLNYEQNDYATLPAAQSQQDQVVDLGGSGCFVATAAFGSYASSNVKALCSVRDSIIKNSQSGASLVALYYDLSPAAAKAIKDSISTRALLRWLLTVSKNTPLEQFANEYIFAALRNHFECNASPSTA